MLNQTLVEADARALYKAGALLARSLSLSLSLSL
jgi:hypothetical protein